MTRTETFIQRVTDKYVTADPNVLSLSPSLLKAELTFFLLLSFRLPQAPEMTDPHCYGRYEMLFDKTLSPYYDLEPGRQQASERQIFIAAHALSSEAAEYLSNPEDLMELGDLWWYITLLWKLLEGPDFEAAVMDIMYNLSNLLTNDYTGLAPAIIVQRCGFLSSYIKKTAEKRMAFDRHHMRDLLASIMEATVEAGFVRNASPGFIMQMNLDKLAGRHPDGFNPDYADQVVETMMEKREKL